MRLTRGLFLAPTLYARCVDHVLSVLNLASQLIKLIKHGLSVPATPVAVLFVRVTPNPHPHPHPPLPSPSPDLQPFTITEPPSPPR